MGISTCSKFQIAAGSQTGVVIFFNLLLNLRSPRDYVGSSAPVVHVLDRKLLERLMSPKSQVMFASAFS